MAGPLQFGQIVWAEIADANGIRKSRPAVVLTPTDRITPSGSIEVVAITSRLPKPIPAHHILLPWHAQGHPRTGLNCKCAAVCTWLARIPPSDVQSIAGLVPGSILAEIVAKVSAISPAPPDSPENKANGDKEG
jgi:mRNA-degrading endonuclease toxin of MazEF toxin-antitoxin module